MTELLELLTKIAEENLKIHVKNSKLWPHAPNILSRKINEIKADLRNIGIIIERSSVDNSNKQWTIKRSHDSDIGTYINAVRNNISYQQEIIRKQNYDKTEHISTISTDRLKPENCAQIAKDISVNTPFNTAQVSTDIPTVRYDQNCAYITSASRSVDSVDNCLLSSHDDHQAKLPKVAETLGSYLAFDFEWDINTHVIEAASFVDSAGNSKVLFRSDFNCSEKELLKCINPKIMEYDWSFGWNSTGHANYAESAKNSDLAILHERCIANDIASIVSLGPNGAPYIGYPKHIDLCNVYSKVWYKILFTKKLTELTS
jgi:hypothetical protein